jgi:Ca-activated chloride channel homolog
MENIKVESKLTYESVRFDQENKVHLVVSLTAPKKDWETERSPICIVPVIDVSGSMAGEKLDYAKKSAIKLVEHLKPGDYIGLVAFSTNVYGISPCIEATSDNKTKLIAKIQEMKPDSSTNFSGGMLKGLEYTNSADLPEKLLKRVIILTDGLANQGIATSRVDLMPLLENKRGTSSLSAFGYGSDADQELLADMAAKGGGNYAFIENPDKALNAFARELGGLLSVYAQNIKIELEMQNGHVLEKVISDVDAEGDNKKTTIKLRDILSEEIQHVVSELKLSKQTQALPRATNVVMLKVSYEVLTKDGSLETRTEELKTKIKFVKEGDQQEKPTEKIDEIVSMHQIVQTQLEANKLVETGDYNGALLKFANLGNSFKSRGRMRSAKVVENLGSNYGSANLYASSMSYRTGLGKGITRGVGAMSYDAKASNDLDMLEISEANSAMSFMEHEFTGPIINTGPASPTIGSIDPNTGETTVITSSGSGTGQQPVIKITTTAGDPLPKTVTVTLDSQGKISKKRSERW